MKEIPSVKMRAGKTLWTEDARPLSAIIDRWARGSTDLDSVLRLIDSSSLDRQHLAAMVLDKGSLGADFLTGAMDDNAFDTTAGGKSLKLLDELLVSPRSRGGAVAALWDAAPRKADDAQSWIARIVTGLSPDANYRVLLVSPEDKLVSKWQRLRAVIAGALPSEQKTAILTMARKQKKLVELYVVTGWEECREMAPDSAKSSMLESDLGL